MPVRFKSWNANRIEAKVASTLRRAGDLYTEETLAQMANPIWPWNWDTLRETSLLMGGETEAGLPGVIVRAGPRDIVDTGELMDSITPPQVTQDKGAAKLSIVWTAPYARKVLEGGVYGSYVNVRGAIVNVGQRPGRNWIQAAYNSKPPAQVFADIWRSFRGT